MNAKLGSTKTVEDSLDHLRIQGEVNHLVALSATLGIYAGIRAIQSKATRGYFAFWKQRKEVFMDAATEQVAAMKLG